MSLASRTKAFVCYAPDDERWLGRILVHLVPLQRQGLIDVWDVSKIQAGEERAVAVQRALQYANCAILIVTPQFLASTAIMTQHIPALLDSAAKKGLRLLPLLVKKSLYEESCLGRYQPFNAESPLAKLTTAKQEELLVELARLISGFGQEDVSASASSGHIEEIAPEEVAAEPPLRHFEQVSKRVDTLGSCKEIHEQLHQLQFTVYQVVLRAQPTFPDDMKSYMEVKGYSRGLERIVGAIKMNDAHAPPGLLSDLEEAQDRMRSALKDRDVNHLQAAIEQMQRILQLFPPTVNHKIQDAVHELAAIQKAEAHTLMAPPWAMALGELFDVGRQVAEVADAHHRWQLIEIELMGTEAVLPYTTGPLQRMHYPKIRGWLSALLQTEPADWREEFEQTATALESAFATREETSIRACFEDYRRALGNRFHEVDLNLLALCRRLCKTASELRDSMQAASPGRGKSHV